MVAEQDGSETVLTGPLQDQSAVFRRPRPDRGPRPRAPRAAPDRPETAPAVGGRDAGRPDPGLMDVRARNHKFRRRQLGRITATVCRAKQRWTPEGRIAMSKEQLSQLDGILRQGRFDTAADVASVRAAFNAFVSQVPVPPMSCRSPSRSAASAASRSRSPATRPITSCCTSIAASTSSVRRWRPSRWWVTSSGERASGPSPSTTGSLPSTLIRPRSTTLVRPMRDCSAGRGPRSHRAGGRVGGRRAGGGRPARAAGGRTADAFMLVPDVALCRSDPVPASPWLRGSRSTDSSPLRACASGLRSTSAGPTPPTRRSARSSGDLSGLPPLLIQVGSHEILLSDALRLAARACHQATSPSRSTSLQAPRMCSKVSADSSTEAAAALGRASDFMKAQLR